MNGRLEQPLRDRRNITIPSSYPLEIVRARCETFQIGPKISRSGIRRKLTEWHFVVADALVEISEEGGGFGGDDGGFAVRSGKGVDGGEGLPVGDYQDFDGPRKRTGADGGAEEAVELAKLRLHGLLEMIDIGIGERGSGECGPEAREHL